MSKLIFAAVGYLLGGWMGVVLALGVHMGLFWLAEKGL